MNFTLTSVIFLHFLFFLFYTIDTSVNNNATFSIGKWRQIRAGLHGIFLHFQSSFVAQWTTVCLSNSEACCNNFPDAVSRSSVYYVKKQPAKALIHSGLLGCEQHLKQSNLPWHHEDGSATSSPNKEWEIDQFKKKKRYWLEDVYYWQTILGCCFFLPLWSAGWLVVVPTSSFCRKDSSVWQGISLELDSRYVSTKRSASVNTKRWLKTKKKKWERERRKI